MKKFGLGLACAFALGLVIGFGQAQADDSAGTSPDAVAGAQSETTAPAIFGVPTDRLYIGWGSTFHGPELNHLDSPVQIDHNGNFSNKNSPLWFDNDVIAGYKVTNDLVIGAAVPFYLAGEGQAFILNDWGVRLKALKLYSNGGFLINGSVYLQAPTSTYSNSMGMWMGLKFTPNLIYSIPSSRFTVGVFTEEKEYFHQRDKSFKIWTAPFVDYQLVPKLSAQVLYEWEVHHNPPTNQGFFQFDGYQSDLQPGVVWNISPNVMVNPYVQIYTSKVSLEHEALGVYIAATVL
jgi:hypothetical protein